MRISDWSSDVRSSDLERLIQASLENQNSKEAQGLAIKVDELLLVAENTPIIIMGAEFLFTLAKLFVVSSQLAIERLSVIRSKKLAIKAGHTYKIFRDEQIGRAHV